MKGNVLNKEEVKFIKVLIVHAELINRANKAKNMQTSDIFGGCTINKEAKEKMDKAMDMLNNFLKDSTEEMLLMAVAAMYVGREETPETITDSNRKNVYMSYYKKQESDARFSIEILTGKYRKLPQYLDTALKLLNPYVESIRQKETIIDLSQGTKIDDSEFPF